MAAVNLTDKYVLNVPTPANRKEIADATLPGFYLVVQSSGAKSWAARYRFGGKPIKQTIGTYPKIGLKDARDIARKIFLAVASGRDPREEMKPEVTLLSSVFPDFITRYMKANGESHNRLCKAAWKNDIKPAWGNKRVSDIRRRDVVVLLDAITDRGAPVQANRIFSILRTFFAWCVNRDLIDFSPLATAKQPNEEKSRSRVLTNDELRLVWLAADRLGYPYGLVTKALILSGQRKMEVGGATFDELLGDPDYQTNMPIWTIPKHRTKNKKDDHVVPMTGMLLTLFNALPRDDDQTHVFTHRRTTAATAYGVAKVALDQHIIDIKREEAEAAGADAQLIEPMDHWTFHDLRRTAATGMARMKIPPHVVEAILNHRSGTISGVAAIYNRYDYFEEKYEAMLKWESAVRRICMGENNVVMLEQHRA